MYYIYFSYSLSALCQQCHYVSSGRYGDPLNPWGDLMAVAEAWCVIASHPLNGWIWFGKGLRGYDNWQRSAASDYKQNGHENMAIPLKSVAATTPKSGAEEKLLGLI